MFLSELVAYAENAIPSKWLVIGFDTSSHKYRKQVRGPCLRPRGEATAKTSLDVLKITGRKKSHL